MMHHHHVPVGLERTERFETYFDTLQFDLARRGLWLRFCSSIGKESKLTSWSLKSESVIIAEDEASVMRALAEELGARPDAVNPISYCRCVVAVLRVRRYAMLSLPEFKSWVDVCYFKKKDFYIVGTIQSSHSPDTVRRAPSKIVAYLLRHCPSTHAFLKAERAPASMFSTTDPFSSDPMLPVVDEDSSSSNDDE
jgi:hypothetical protein